MAEQIGGQIKEARLAAGLSQKALAEAIDGLSAESISKAERGLRELPDEQLVAIAEATGWGSALFGVGESEAHAASEESAAAPAADENDILKLFNEADPAVREAALSVLKGESPKSKGFLADVLPLVSGMLGGDKGDVSPASIIGFLGSDEGKALLDALKGVMDNFTDTFGGIGEGGNGGNDGKRKSDSILAFTFFYTVAIYLLLIGFHYMQGQADNTPEK